MPVLKARNSLTGEWERIDVNGEVLITDQTYSPESENAQSGKAVAEAVENNPDRHAEYFTITDDGIVSLKPEYRGACPSNRSQYTFAISDNGIGVVGSKNAELPKCLFIPERVGNIAVYKLADAMFLRNNAVVDLVCPKIVTEIPERFCDNARGVKNLYGTENIELIDKLAFQRCGIEKIYFPKLKELGGNSVFSQCGNLIYADIGNVTSITERAFAQAINLNRIKNSDTITSVEKGAFYLTGNLKNIDFIPTLTSIGQGAFLMSRYTYDWDTLTNCTFGTNATSKQINPTDYWNGCTFTSCKNNLPTLLCQDDPEWASRKIGTTAYSYVQGCVMFSYMHIYCGLHNLKLLSVLEFENIMAEIDPNLINTFIPDVGNSKNFLPKLGFNAEYHSSISNTEDAQAIYNALSNGKYVIFAAPGGYSTTDGHSVVAYGINDCGELLIADSTEFVQGIECTAGTYAVSPKNMPNTNEYCIVSL